MKNHDTPTREAAEYDIGGTPVNNADIPLLADVLCIMQDVCQIEQRREWQQERMHNITQHLTGTVHGGGAKKGLDEAIALLSELDEEHEKLCIDYIRLLKEAQRILDGIESRSMRTFVMMKYVMHLPDKEIRKELNMTRWRFNMARNSVETAWCMADVKWKEYYVAAEKKTHSI